MANGGNGKPPGRTSETGGTPNLIGINSGDVQRKHKAPLAAVCEQNGRGPGSVSSGVAKKTPGSSNDLLGPGGGGKSKGRRS